MGSSMGMVALFMFSVFASAYGGYYSWKGYERISQANVHVKQQATRSGGTFSQGKAAEAYETLRHALRGPPVESWADSRGNRRGSGAGDYAGEIDYIGAYDPRLLAELKQEGIDLTAISQLRAATMTMFLHPDRDMRRRARLALEVELVRDLGLGEGKSGSYQGPEQMSLAGRRMVLVVYFAQNAGETYSRMLKELDI